MKKIIIIILIGLGIVFAGAVGVLYRQYINDIDGGGMNEEKIHIVTISEIPAEKLEALAGKRIFFGHQSVGGNIMEGLAELDGAHGSLHLNIVKTTDLSGIEGPVFAHQWIGKNMAPKSKVDEFARLMRNDLKDKVDIAFFKFCYVDFHYDTDLEPILDYYKSTMARLEKEFPNVIFFHSTVPYNIRTGGFKGFLENLLGRDHNIKRSGYNRMLRREYGPVKLFDLARFESTYPDGKRERSGKNSYAIIPAYSESGGHLNKKGREVIATQLLNFLTMLL